MFKPLIGFKVVPGEGKTMQERIRRWRWDGQPPRPPRKGEHYLSGAVPYAYLAPNDLSTPYYIAVEADKGC